MGLSTLLDYLETFQPKITAGHTPHKQVVCRLVVLSFAVENKAKLYWTDLVMSVINDNFHVNQTQKTELISLIRDLVDGDTACFQQAKRVEFYGRFVLLQY